MSQPRPVAIPRRILVPVDFSPASTDALLYAELFGEKFGARIDVVHVWEPPLFLTPELVVYSPGAIARNLEDVARERATEKLTDTIAGIVMRKRVEVHHRVEVGPPAERILEAARDCDLIVMGTHGRTGIAHLVMGSIAEKVTRRAPCPVLTVHSDETKT